MNNFNIETLSEHGFSLIARKSARQFKKKISLETYLNAQHILYTPTEKPGSHVDDILRDLGHKRESTLTTSYLSSIPIHVSKSDYLSIVPCFYANFAVKHFDIKILDIPFEIPAFKHQMVWHKSRDNSPSHLWLRNYIKANYKTLLKS